MPRPDVVAVVLAAAALGGCITEAECDLRIAAAHREALRDAEACVWAPDALRPADCGGQDRRPLTTYEGVWCSSAELGCVRSLPDADALCFGEPTE